MEVAVDALLTLDWKSRFFGEVLKQKKCWQNLCKKMGGFLCDLCFHLKGGDGGEIFCV